MDMRHRDEDEVQKMLDVTCGSGRLMGGGWIHVCSGACMWLSECDARGKSRRHFNFFISRQHLMHVYSGDELWRSSE